MKTATKLSLTVKIEETILEKFQPVDETLATNFILPKTIGKTKQFGVVDLWKCNKQKRYAGIRIS